jgi:hypothetical protein
MSLPDEKYRAVEYAREFMRDLLDPKKTPRIHSSIRKRAYNCLKHYPGDLDMQMAAEKVPKIFDANRKR